MIARSRNSATSRRGRSLRFRQRPSFECATAKREVEKVICADPQLGMLDRQIAEITSAC